MTDSPGFPMEVVDPADLARSWERDDMHMPFAMTPLAADYITTTLGRSFDHHWERFGGSQRIEPRVWHGYAYFNFESHAPSDEAKAAGERWTEVLRSRVPATHEYWETEARPELGRLYASIEAVAVDELAPAELVRAWDEAWSTTLRAWQIHFVTIMGPYQVLEDLSDLYATALGAGRDVEALSLIRGQEHELEDVEARIEVLAGMLRADPELTDAVGVAAERPGDEGAIDRDTLRAVPGGPEFVAALDAFLQLHGHLGQTHDDLGLASWAEAPAALLANLVRRVPTNQPPVGARLAELRRAAAERTAAARAALADRPDELARFETVLEQALEIGYLTEGHNYWIDRMAQARLRTLVTRVARRLVREGVLARAADVWLLGRAEIATALVDGAPRHALVRERADILAWQRTLEPPRWIGPVPDDTGPSDRFDTVRIESTEPDELRGTGSSAGVVRGPARVVLSQDDFGRVQPGDIIVCPSSNPSWVPVFTIAGGLVTNTGGVLSHAAVVAREFGLPAVTGVVGATTKIRPGRLVEIDGTAGTVRLL